MKRILAFLIGLSVLAWLPVAALERLDLADVVVPVEDRSSGARQEALREGLEKVVVRMTGDPAAPENELLSGLLRDPNRWLEHYGYRDDEQAGLKLEASFGQSALSRALRDAGVPVWGAARPPVLLWLVGDGGNILAEGGETKLHRALREHSSVRGLPLQLPEMDSRDRSAIVAADIRGRFDRQLRAASARYDRSLVAAAVIYPDTEPYLRWRLFENGEPLEEGREQAAADAEAPGQELARILVDRLAREVARRYAVTGTELTQMSVRVEGLASLEGFSALRGHVEELPGVESLDLVRLQGATVDTIMGFHGPAQQLERLLRLHPGVRRCDEPDLRVGEELVQALRLCWRGQE